MIREREISLWRSEGGDLGGGAGGVWRRGRARGWEGEVGKSGAEVTSLVTRELTRERSSGDEGAHEDALER